MSCLPPLTSEQRQAIEEARGSPVLVVDRVNMEKYVLVHNEFFCDLVAMLHEHDVQITF